MPKPRAKIGEKRKVNQPLIIDRLPQAARDAIVLLHDTRGLSWEQIEDKSALPYSEKWEIDDVGFINWETLPLDVLELFPRLRIARNTLNRWHDLRIEQVRKEVLAESAASRAFAEKFVSADVDGGNNAVINAMRDEIFSLSRSVDVNSRKVFVKQLQNLTLAISRIQRLELQKKKVDADVAKSEAERAKYAALAGDPREVYLQAAQDILKKLMTRKQVRAVLDPLKDELIQEFSHGAESFAKQVEASAS